MVRRIRVPRIASVGHNRRQHSLLQQGRLLNCVDVQPSAHVPCDVAMEGPRAGVICVVLQDNVCRPVWSPTLNQLGITALGVRLVGDLAVPFSETFGEHVEVVAVQMHRVGCQEFVVNHKAHGGVGAKVVDSPDIGIGEVAGVGKREDRVVVVGTEAHVVDIEKERTSTRCGSVGMSCDGEVLANRRVACRWVWEEWRRLRKIIVATLAVIVRSSLRLGHGVCVGFFIIDGSQSVRIMSGIARRTEISAHPNGRVGWACSCHNDIGPLTDTESDHGSSVWLDRHKIVSNDRHVEAINSESLNAFGAAVDKPQSVLLAGLELELGKTGVR